MDLDELSDLKKKMEQYQKKMDEAQGAKAILENQLQKEFGCKDVFEAERMLKRLIKQKETLQQELEKKVEEFETKWKDKLNR